MEVEGEKINVHLNVNMVIWDKEMMQTNNKIKVHEYYTATS